MASKLETINANINVASISTAVSPQLHPDQILPLGQELNPDENGIGHTAYTSGRTALKTLYDSLAEIDMAVRTTKLSPNSTPEIEAELINLMGAKYASVAQTCDHQLQNINKSIDDLTTRIDTALKPRNVDANTAAQASDIRRYVSTLDAKDRANFIHRAIETDNDKEVAAAILNTTPFTSGLNREQHALVRSIAEQKFAAGDWKARAAAIKLRDHVQTASQLWCDRYKQLLPKPSTDPAQKARAALKVVAS